MEGAKVIEFPKEKSVRMRMQNKANEQKAVLIASLASVFVVTMFLNQWMNQSALSGSGVGGRQIASIDSASMAKDIKWEQDIAKKMARDSAKLNINFAEAPTLRDELIFVVLEGKYGMKLAKEGGIESLQFIQNQNEERPLEITNKTEFLMKYSEAFGKKYNEVSLSGNERGSLTYDLIDSSKVIVGKAQFSLTDEGRVQAIRFTY